MAQVTRTRIVGWGALTGAGRGPSVFWEALCAARPLQQTHDLGDLRLSEARWVAIPEPREPQPDLATTWLNLAIHDALLLAAPSLSRLAAPRVALLCGSSLGGMSLFEAHHRRLWDPHRNAGPGLPTEVTELSRALYDGPTKEVAKRTLPSAFALTLNTACSSSANALGLGRLWLALHRIDVAVVAGVDVISPFVYAGFQCLGAVDPKPSTPFAAERRGLNLGEAAAAFVLVRAEDAAPLDLPIDLIGYGSSCDAYHLTRPDPGGLGLVRAIATALDDAHLQPEAIGLVSSHGTGTLQNDSMEAAAFATSFGSTIPPFHCAKPIAGHALGASGAIDALAVLLMLQQQILPSTFLRGSEDPTLPCHPERQQRSLAAETVALSTSSGFGGSNAALLLQRGDV